MCLIIHADTAHPQDKEITAAAAHNRDGIGIAYYNPQTTLVEWIKGLTTKQAITAKKDMPLPAIYHFRLATHGGDSPLLCHPFPITRNVGITTRGEAREVLFHNGVWMHYAQFIKKARLKGPVSDTRIMAWALWNQGQAAREETAKVLATESGKLAVFSGDTITTYGDWTEGDPEKHKETSAGCWYSNLSWCWPEYASHWAGNSQFYRGGLGSHGQLVGTHYIDDYAYEYEYTRTPEGKYVKSSAAERLRSEGNICAAGLSTDPVDDDGFIEDADERDTGHLGGHRYYHCEGCDTWKERITPQDLQFLDGREELCRECNLALQGITDVTPEEEAKADLQPLADYLADWNSTKVFD